MALNHNSKVNYWRSNFRYFSYFSHKKCVRGKVFSKSGLHNYGMHKPLLANIMKLGEYKPLPHFGIC